MRLSADKTYRTRDGSRTGIRVRQRARCDPSSLFTWIEMDGSKTYKDDGSYGHGYHAHDLLEDLQPAAPQPFSYDACPVGEDGRRRAVTQSGLDVVLLCRLPKRGVLAGVLLDGEHLHMWCEDGDCVGHSDELDLLVPSPPKRVVWVNLYERGGEICAYVHETLEGADNVVNNSGRIGNRAYPIEIDP